MTVMEAAKLLGEVLATEQTVALFNRTKADYESCEELQNAIAEYSTQRMLLGREYAKDTAMQDAQLILSLQKRIGELSAFVNGHPLYLALQEGQKKVATLMTQVNGEINFYAFGERPCTHDCSSCKADCASRS